uniref:Uncharacterized protein n=1 Tax=Acrobeloides nanus TaxID=290746 RepID=A0A914DWA0_9BILA
MNSEVEATEKVINAMAYYKRHALHRLKLQAEAVLKLPIEDRRLVIPEIPNQARLIKEYAQVNQKLIDLIIRCGVGMLGDDSAIKAAYEITQLRPPSEHFMTKTKSTLKQIVRDWTKE